MMTMEHPAAVEYTVERYLLDELPPDDRDAFEAHCFDCPQCAEELKIAAAFVSAARRELQRGGFVKVAAPSTRPTRAAWYAFLWRPAFLSPVAALLLVTVIYQNVILRARPEILPSISLIGSGSRGGSAASETLRDGDSLLLSFDVPAAERFTTYSAEFVDPAGRTLWSTPVSADQARDTVSLRVPARRWEPGDYALLLLGHAPAEAAPSLLARYRFVVKRPT